MLTIRLTSGFLKCIRASTTATTPTIRRKQKGCWFLVGVQVYEWFYHNVKSLQIWEREENYFYGDGCTFKRGAVAASLFGVSGPGFDPRSVRGLLGARLSFVSLAFAKSFAHVKLPILPLNLSEKTHQMLDNARTISQIKHDKFLLTRNTKSVEWACVTDSQDYISHRIVRTRVCKVRLILNTLE